MDTSAPSDDDLLWDLEPGAEVVEPRRLPKVDAEPPMATRDFDAVTRSARWMALSPYVGTHGLPAGSSPLASPLFGSIQTEDYQLVPLVRALKMPRVFAPAWLSLLDSLDAPARAALVTIPWRKLWAVSPHERLRLRCILDAVVAHLYSLDEADFRWILRDCDHPVEQVTNKAFARTLDPKGFWRVDKHREPELRHTVLAQVAFADLQAMIREHGEEIGLQRFLGTGPDDGWMLPETLRLADYNLGHDARAKEPQKVAAALGPRFYDWQLTQSAEESWAECRMHAEKIRRIRSIGRPQAEATSRVSREAAKTAKGREAKNLDDDMFGGGL